MEFKRICVICGDEFATTCHNKSVCSKDHYHPCPVCGKDVLSNKVNRQDCTCSRECGKIVAQQSRVSTYKDKYGVESLGQLPEVRKSTSERNRSHKKEPVYSNCAICGKQIELRWPYDPEKQKTCSRSCRAIYVKQSGISKSRTLKASDTLKRKYGVSNASELQHLKKTCKCCGKAFETDSARREYCYDKHYGPCPVCGKEVEIREMSIGPQACSEECRQKRIAQTCMQIYGDESAVNSEYCREVAKLTNIKHYGVPHYSQTREYHVKCARTKFDIIASDGTHLDSKYELSFYEFVKSIGLTMEYQIPFQYTYDIPRMLFIDFRVNNMLFECKGGHFISGSYSKDPNHTLLKFQLYKEFGGHLVTDLTGFSNIKSHTDSVVKSLTCIDIELFRKDISLDSYTIWNNILNCIDNGIQFISIDEVLHI